MHCIAATIRLGTVIMGLFDCSEKFPFKIYSLTDRIRSIILPGRDDLVINVKVALTNASRTISIGQRAHNLPWIC